ncbi:tRNA uridine 5-carboxymethylaminomethyl modification enzyme MnmG [Clostridia bacterium]|nr:tRNA uridine 5-carboxymethylaminomethyl modification enzyme MnmG [Clostridia bacterium]
MTAKVAVVGAGHAGFEAALAAARLGCEVLVFALHIDSVGNMPCNPAIGGTAKGQIVREIDALGGEMGRAADACGVQFRMLNRGKGPAVRSPRSQTDRRKYSDYVRDTLEAHPNITLLQREIASLRPLVDTLGVTYDVQAVVLASGTYLKGRVITGEHIRDGGPDGLQRADALSDTLADLGLRLRRFKTGTPPRLLRRSVDVSVMEEQPGEDDAVYFSFENPNPPVSEELCWLTWTNERTHEVLKANLHRSPMYNGAIVGVGPRYCPSIEDKVVRFADKARHPLFIEPMGRQSSEIYLQGFSSSMPVEVQLDAIRTVNGLENAVISRAAYAIEYDCADPLCLDSALMVRDTPGIFAAGQVCGSSGYEEAACQGLVAGINAARYVFGKAPLILSRVSSYIGTLIDDLTTKGTEEPYRMMTSRSEYRMLLRHDNADRRLTAIGHEVGLISDERFEEFLRYEAAIAAGDASNPRARYQLELEAMYAGYIRRQEQLWKRVEKAENRRIPIDFDYTAVKGLSHEAAQKLSAVRPLSLGQAGRISGVSPSDVTAIMLKLR